jgi:hypothetical protein
MAEKVMTSKFGIVGGRTLRKLCYNNFTSKFGIVGGRTLRKICYNNFTPKFGIVGGMYDLQLYQT